MVLKMLDFEPAKEQKDLIESWTYFDNVTSARVTYDEELKETVVACTFKGSDSVTIIVVKYCAFLLTDVGGLIEHIKCVDHDAEEQDNSAGTTLQEAVIQAWFSE